MTLTRAVPCHSALQFKVRTNQTWYWHYPNQAGNASHSQLRLQHSQLPVAHDLQFGFWYQNSLERGLPGHTVRLLHHKEGENRAMLGYLGLKVWFSFPCKVSRIMSSCHTSLKFHSCFSAGCLDGSWLESGRRVGRPRCDWRYAAGAEQCEATTRRSDRAGGRGAAETR